MGITFIHNKPLEIKSLAYKEGKIHKNDRTGLAIHQKLTVLEIY